MPKEAALITMLNPLIKAMIPLTTPSTITQLASMLVSTLRVSLPAGSP